jgi:hypothetical protein
MGEELIQRSFQTRKFKDRILDPPEFVDEEVPSLTIKLPYRGLQGRQRAPRGTHTGTYYIKGTQYDTGIGTYGVRITRLSVFAGSRDVFWHIRHSRIGTVDIIYFPASGQEYQLGNGMAPIYSFGPGTISHGFLNAGSAYWMGYHLEGVPSIDV